MCATFQSRSNVARNRPRAEDATASVYWRRITTTIILGGRLDINRCIANTSSTAPSVWYGMGRPGKPQLCRPVMTGIPSAQTLLLGFFAELDTKSMNREGRGGKEVFQIERRRVSSRCAVSKRVKHIRAHERGRHSIVRATNTSLFLLYFRHTML